MNMLVVILLRPSRATVLPQVGTPHAIRLAANSGQHNVMFYVARQSDKSRVHQLHSDGIQSSAPLIHVMSFYWKQTNIYIYNKLILLLIMIIKKK